MIEKKKNSKNIVETGVVVTLRSVRSDGGDSHMECKTSTRVVIRTADYIHPFPEFLCRGHCSGAEDGNPSDCFYSTKTCRQRLSAVDLVTLHRKCSVPRGSCDVSTVGITKPFEVTYFCVDGKCTCREGLRWEVDVGRLWCGWVGAAEGQVD